ncbi:hypothetical protein EAF00_011140 [Botryotinia globosa]|nr:hypothetical protein EAF00_011140 [Botryotinia globosa]
MNQSSDTSPIDSCPSFLTIPSMLLYLTPSFHVHLLPPSQNQMSRYITPLLSLDSLDDGNGYGHDFMDAANDLHEIILVIASKKLGLEKTDVGNRRLSVIFVAASVGVPIARLYIKFHPFICAALIALDSNIANVDYSDFLPDPSSPTFDSSIVLAPDC